MPETHEQLMLKKLLGTISPEEEVAFKNWLRSDPKNKQTYEEYKRRWQIQQSEAPEFTPHGDGKAPNPVITETSRPRKNLASSLSQAAAILLLCIASWLIYEGLRDRTRVFTSREKIMAVGLEDSSAVYLRPHSSLTVSGRYGNNNRTVELEGEAFFEVKPNPSKPFIVKGPSSRVEVLGTAFLLSARKNHALNEVHVLRGRVRFSPVNDQEKEVILTAGKKGIVDTKANALSMTDADTTNLLAWRTRQLIFMKTPMRDVVKAVEDYFGIDVAVRNQALLDCPFTSSFTDPALDDVMDAISNTLRVNVLRHGHSITMEGGRCR